MPHMKQFYRSHKAKGPGKVKNLHIHQYTNSIFLRIRGYQASLGATPQKLNKAPYRRLTAESQRHNAGSTRMLDDGKEKISESGEVELGRTEMDDLGFAQLYDEEKDQSLDQS